MPNYLKEELYKELRESTSLFDFIQDSVLDGLWYWDLENPEQEWMNHKFWRVLGYDPKEKKHLSGEWQDIINQDDLQTATQTVLKHLENPEIPYDQVVRYRHKEGHTVWIRCHGLAIRDKEGRPIRMIGVHNDITEIQNAKEQIEEKNASMGKYIDLVNKYIITSSTDFNGVITEVSQAFCDISGYSKEELIGKSHRILRHFDMPNELYEDMWSNISSGKIWRGEIKNLNKRGESYWVDNIIEPKFDQDRNIIGYTSIRQDITDKKTIEEISITDGLTDIYNRRHFNDIFPKVLSAAKRDDKLLCFLMMDIDFFKPYNDNYGHQMGDAVLIKVAKCFKENLKRANDKVFRLGGEEFGILFETETQEGALAFADTLRKKVHDLKIVHEYSSVTNHITVSMGLLCLKASRVKNVDTMYKQADDLLYKSKEGGRNRVLMMS